MLVYLTFHYLDVHLFKYLSTTPIDPSMTVRCMYISSIYRFFAVRHYNIILMDGGVISHALTFFVFPTTDCCFLRIIDARGTSSIVATIEVTSYVHFSDF